MLIKLTSYNPEVGQTDSTPCIAGGTGINICEEAKNGQRILALSQDLTAWSNLGRIRKGLGHITFEAGEIVMLESTDYPDDWRCNGEFKVADAMNARYKERGDIFFMNRSDNISCDAIIYKINK